MSSSSPIAFSFGSHASSHIRDVIQSYRRAQLYLADSVSGDNSGPEDEEDDYDIEHGSVFDDDFDINVEYRQTREVDPVTGNLQWDGVEDDDITPGPSSASRPFLLPIPTSRRVESPSLPTPTTPSVQERTPLLHKASSLTFLESPNPRRASVASPLIGFGDAQKAEHPHHHPHHRVALARRDSQYSTLSTRRSFSGKSVKHVHSGRSTFGQTLFNAIAILLGIGMLSEPLAFAYAGWIGGTALIVFYGFICCYTAKILAHIIMDDPKLRSYSDIGKKAFGPRSGPWISALFCLELFTVSVALVTLYADSLHSVLPDYSPNCYKVIGFFILVPTMLMPLSALSYASILGILSTIFIVVVVFIDGFSKADSPGSLWNPAPTSFSIAGIGELGIAFGLFMAGFSGHAVIPSLVRDMVDPTQFDRMIDYAFFIATIIYATIGAAGYLMFGNGVSEEFSQDLMKITGYNPVLNQIALWGLVLTPLSKYALATRPLAITLEMILGIDTGSGAPDDHGEGVKAAPNHVPISTDRHNAFKGILTTVERTLFVCLSVVVSILVPEFSAMMAFLGAFSSFLLCVIGPVSAKISLSGRSNWGDCLLLVIAVVMATWGTGAAFWSTT